ncbi:TPA: hypothetical protein ACSQRH_001556 [Clostridium perfringens]
MGKCYSTTDFVYHTNAQKLRYIAYISISTSVQKVTYPALSFIKKIIKISVILLFR